LALILLVWMVEHGQLALASAGAAAGAVFLLGERLHGLGRTSGSVYENTLYMQDYSTFLRRWPPRPQPTDRPPLPAFTDLRAEGLSFMYPSRDTLAIEDVSIEIRKGEIVALVGENGSGKTTLAKILAGLYTPEAGRILWDGVDLRHMDPSTVRRSVAVIFQEYGHYQMTAAENIGFGDIERLDDRAAIVDAAQWAGADEFIRQLPKDYDNMLGSEYYGGANISLGQWQRVALARAYFRNSPFVILDEPTASLDPRAEADLFRNVRALYQGRSVLLISHRFSSARSADRIYVLEKGRVIETGSHEQLLLLDGRYAELFNLQAAAYNMTDPRPSLDPSLGS
jgi:ATP-binding cassette subfamily B protein